MFRLCLMAVVARGCSVGSLLYSLSFLMQLCFVVKWNIGSQWVGTRGHVSAFGFHGVQRRRLLVGWCVLSPPGVVVGFLSSLRLQVMSRRFLCCLWLTHLLPWRMLSFCRIIHLRAWSVQAVKSVSIFALFTVSSTLVSPTWCRRPGGDLILRIERRFWALIGTIVVFHRGYLVGL